MFTAAECDVLIVVESASDSEDELESESEA